MDRYRTVGAVIAAAGSSSRMGGRDKLAEPLDGIPVILRTLAAVEAVPEIREIVVVTREESSRQGGRPLRPLDGWSKAAGRSCRGGEQLASSRRRIGLRALSRRALPVPGRPRRGPSPLRHRPSSAGCIAATPSPTAAAAAAVPVKDTIKVADEARTASSTPPPTAASPVCRARPRRSSRWGRYRRASGGGPAPRGGITPTTASSSRAHGLAQY